MELGSGMAALLIVSYDVSDPDRYAEYNPGGLEAIMGTVAKYGGAPVAVGPPDVVTGTMEQFAITPALP